MDILLLTVTVISLVVALIMSAAALRAARQERARSAARVAALAAAAADSEPFAEPQLAWEPVAVNETKTAAPWAPARVSQFPSENADRFRSPKPLLDDPVGGAFLGSAVAAAPSGGRQRGLAIAAGLLFVALVAGGYWTLYGAAPSSATAAGAASSAPLELVSLRHERRGGRLSISGLVRNPAGGAPVERLNAVVFLFDQQGAFVTSARADVDFTRLTAGDESPFVVAVDAPAGVARYRVSFRNEAGVVPHVDRRGQEPIARELP